MVNNKKPDKIVEYNKAALDAGMSYGKYVALMHSAKPQSTVKEIEKPCPGCGCEIAHLGRNRKTCGKKECRLLLERQRSRERYRNMIKATGNQVKYQKLKDVKI